MKKDDNTREAAKRIGIAIHNLSEREQTRFLFTLLGVCEFGAPEMVVNAAEFSQLQEKLEKALDATA